MSNMIPLVDIDPTTLSISGWNNLNGTVTTAAPSWQDTYTINTAGSGAWANGVEITGSLVVNGLSVTDRLNKVEERLGIIQPNEKLENRWEELKALGDQYRQLEAELTSKEKMWEIIKR